MPTVSFATACLIRSWNWVVRRIVDCREEDAINLSVAKSGLVVAEWENRYLHRLSICRRGLSYLNVASRSIRFFAACRGSPFWELAQWTTRPTPARALSRPSPSLQVSGPPRDPGRIGRRPSAERPYIEPGAQELAHEWLAECSGRACHQDGTSTRIVLHRWYHGVTCLRRIAFDLDTLAPRRLTIDRAHGENRC